MYRVVFPFDLKLRNTTDDCTDADQAYNLFAVVVHVGSGPNHGTPRFLLWSMNILGCSIKLHILICMA